MSSTVKILCHHFKLDVLNCLFPVETLQEGTRPYVLGEGEGCGLALSMFLLRKPS